MSQFPKAVNRRDTAGRELVVANDRDIHALGMESFGGISR